jgi:hypothetical protein
VLARSRELCNGSANLGAAFLPRLFPIVVAFQAPLSFLNAYHFRRDILAILHDAPVPVVRLVTMLEIDFMPRLMRHVMRRG